MTNAPVTDVRQKALRVLIPTVVLVIVVAVLGLVFVSQGFESAFFVPGFALLGFLLVTLSLWILLIAFPSFALAGDARLSALTAANPAATIVHIVTTFAAVRQLRAVAAALGEKSRIRNFTYVTLVADAENLIFYGGSSAPTPLLTVPRTAVASVEYGESTGTRGAIPSIKVVFADMPTVPVLLVPVYWPGVGVKPVPQDVLLQQIASISGA